MNNPPIYNSDKVKLGDLNEESGIGHFFAGNPYDISASFYNDYDYDSFWVGRNFENLADQIAISRLIDKIPPPHRKIIDIGAGTGRISPLYGNKWQKMVLLDPSLDQLDIAKKRIRNPDEISFVQGTTESIPLANDSCDAAICIRTFHYVNNPQKAIHEIKRILAPNGYLILEIPNKRHIKVRLRALFSSRLKREISSQNPRSLALEDKSILFVNHHPEVIRDILLAEQFEIIDILSVSNFRSSFFKNLIPLKILLFFERLLQFSLAKIWFGPSIYFLVRKSKT